jgi:hypothetical protein
VKYFKSSRAGELLSWSFWAISTNGWEEHAVMADLFFGLAKNEPQEFREWEKQSSQNNNGIPKKRVRRDCPRSRIVGRDQPGKIISRFIELQL